MMDAGLLLLENQKNGTNNSFEASNAVNPDPEHKVVTELYIALLPAIITSWKENASVKKTKFATVASEVTINEMDPTYEVEIEFKNGNSFRGSVKDKRLHGEGVYRWSDGTIYEGKFNENKLEGESKIFYSSGDRYFGESSYGYHHGNGLFVSDVIRYGGEFDSGMFHGNGNLETTEGSFEGIFTNNKIDEGTRVYDDGVFIGKFNLCGERSKGRFLLSNGDIYNGKWQQDHYCEFGTYRWNPCHQCLKTENKFIIPRENYFAGYWADSYRFGPGVLQIDERIMMTTWKFDKKCGPGVVIAANGDTFVSEKMYLNGRYREGLVVRSTEESDKHIQSLKHIMKQAARMSLMENRFCSDSFSVKEMITSMNFEAIVPAEIHYLLEFAEVTDVPPMFLPRHMVNLKSTPIVSFVAEYLPDVDHEALEVVEIKSLNQAISSKLAYLEEVYTRYARYGLEGCSGKPSFMLRLGLWRFLRTIQFFDKKFNIVSFLEDAEYSFHMYSEDLRDPFEIVCFWQFLKYVLCVTMHLNRNRSLAQKTMQRRAPFFGLFATMFMVFLRDYEKNETLPIDNFPIVLTKDLIVTEFIFEFIKEYQSKCSLRMTYKLFTSIIEKLNVPKDDNLLQPTDFIHCVSQVLPATVQDDILTLLDVQLTLLEIFEILYLIISRLIRNKKYSQAKNKFLEKFNKKQKKLEEEAEAERARQALEKALQEEEEAAKKKRRKSKK